MKRTRHHQEGYVFKKGSAWFLRYYDTIVVAQIPRGALLEHIPFLMVTSSLHEISFLRTRPASLLLPLTIRRSAQSSSSGLPHRKRTYLPKRTCGRGSSLLVRTRSRTQVSGTLQRTASCLQSMNSY